MKKLIKILSLSLLVIIVGMSFASCGFIFDMVNNVVNSTEEEEEPETSITIEEAATLLENEGYDVGVWVLGETTSTAFSSEELERYSILSAYIYDNMSGATSNDLYMYFFNEETAAEVYYEEIKDNWQTTIFSPFFHNTSNMSCGIKGKVVYCGSNEAISILFDNN